MRERNAGAVAVYAMKEESGKGDAGHEVCCHLADFFDARYSEYIQLFVGDCETRVSWDCEHHGRGFLYCGESGWEGRAEGFASGGSGSVV